MLDDPGFDFNFDLPEFNLDLDGILSFGQSKDSQKTNKTSSQMSPFEHATPSSGHSINIGGLQIPRSSSLSNFGIASPFGRDSMSQLKHPDGGFEFGDDQEAAIGHFGLEIDEFGNIIEPELPPMRSSQMERDEEMRDAQQSRQPEDQQLLEMGEDLIRSEINIPNGRDEVLVSGKNDIIDENTDAQEVIPAQPQKKKQRKAKTVPIDPDGGDRVVRAEFRAWNDNYLENMERARKPPRTTAPAQAKRNAAKLVFGLGITELDTSPKKHEYVHPLAECFGHKALQTRFLGFEVDGDEDFEKRGRRRSSDEAFEDVEEGRRVRRRLDGEQDGAGQAVQPLNDDYMMELVGDEEDVEVGRAPDAVLSDHPSLPWNRPSPQVPGSSVLGSAQRDSARKGQGQESPLVGRGSVIHDIERYSDTAPFGSDGLQPRFSDNLYSDGPGFNDSGHSGDVNTSQLMRDALDREGQNFLGFLERVAGEKGQIRGGAGDDDGRCWITFDDLFEREDKTRVAAAQAFHHVLSLATKGVIRIEQEGQNKVAYGVIHIGVALSGAGEDLRSYMGEMEERDDAGDDNQVEE